MQRSEIMALLFSCHGAVRERTNKSRKESFETSKRMNKLNRDKNKDCLPSRLKVACSFSGPEAERNYLLLLLLHPYLFVLEA